MNTSSGSVQHSCVLDAVFLLGDCETARGAVDKAMPVEWFCILCMERVRGREWMFKSDCPKCLGECSLKTFADYVCFSQLTRSTSKVVAKRTSKLTYKRKSGGIVEEVRTDRVARRMV